MRILNY
ncbi:hypothetical protein PENANT_c051G06732 [Penicillium antarcticum]|nr:hypothetical protein PENANT_c051G06732 [Penicillium antarcticum]